MIKKIIRHIEGLEISIIDWIISFLGIIFIRFLLESISISDPSGFIAIDAQTLIHYGLFYFAAAIGSMVILQFFTHKRDSLKNDVLFFLIYIWLAPIIDFFVGKITGLSLYYRYISDGGFSLARDFFTFFGPQIFNGATIGIRIEIVFILCGVVWFIWNKTKSRWKTIIGTIVIYAFIFTLFALPGIIFAVSHINSGSNAKGGQYIIHIISTSNLSFNSTDSVLIPYSAERLLEIEFDKLMSQFLFLISCLLLFVWFWQIEKEKLIIILKNSRPERVGYYLVLVCLGMWYAYLLGIGHITSWVDILGIACLLIAFFSGWLFAIHINDCEDKKIDEISNKHRPLVQGTISEKEMYQSGIIWLSIGLLGAWCAGYYPFYMMCVFVMASYIYSAKPLRLKIVPVISTFLMSVMSLTSILAGFFFLSQNKTFYSFPPLAMVGILIFYTLLTNVKDLKDIEGDTANGILTIPVLMGKKKAFIICGGMVVLGLLLIPMFFTLPSLYIISFPAAIASYYFIVRKPYKEKYLFLIYFISIVCGLILFFPS